MKTLKADWPKSVRKAINNAHTLHEKKEIIPQENNFQMKIWLHRANNKYTKAHIPMIKPGLCSFSLVVLCPETDIQADYILWCQGEDRCSYY